ncbi:MAG: ChaN family lipoprotein [Verrucomicrobiota bacterium]
MNDHSIDGTRPNDTLRPAVLTTALLMLLVGSACSSVDQSKEPQAPLNLPEWVVYNGQNGQTSSWKLLRDQALQSNIVLVGEEHTNPIAHQLELKLVTDIFEHFPDTAVAMEMFERHEQAFVDLYLTDRINSETLFETTDSKGWGGSLENWSNWYLPIVDAAKSNHNAGGDLIAANAPRSYVRLARLESHEILKEIPTTAPQPFVVPDPEVDDSPYHERFVNLMTSYSSHTIDTDAYFRAQQLWDATMAESVANATAEHSIVVLIAGDFHVANKGGTTARIKHRLPGAKVITISIVQKTDPAQFDSSDIGRADFVVYTR